VAAAAVAPEDPLTLFAVAQSLLAAAMGHQGLLAAAVGSKGLAINDPSQEQQLRHALGRRTVSALQVACSLDVGVQLLLPGQDAGIDLAREYEMERGMVGDGEKTP
jgi:hypothetical protein